MPAEIKPCPFCGKLPRLSHVGELFYIECVNLDCGLWPSTKALNSEGVIVALWNRRADIKEAGQPDVQQLKPKMPSEEDCWNIVTNGIEFSDDFARTEEAHDVTKIVYGYIAQHFGH